MLNKLILENKNKNKNNYQIRHKLQSNCHSIKNYYLCFQLSNNIIYIFVYISQHNHDLLKYL